ncbi:dirigent protein 21-like [Punica granatum]|uniref:Dirigent protein n=2 Tax=Punica granatum TaxID=22663 RepID=A0A218XD57_PUNGR|nr:dirigent protein 21-like [Punica granatum]OWM82636.1 hypothetical protein CDL15_Pgr002211 [Punica granatum]PKI32825.1 hypothetical protein CRG98_046818 [Punica granatum]
MALYSRAVVFMSFISSLMFILAASETHPFSRSLSAHKPWVPAKHREKLTHLHFYFHDIISGRNTTAVRVAGAPASAKSPTAFGTVFVTDDPLTLGPDLGSRLVGRAQGMYGSASLAELGLVMVMNFVFLEGKYKDSSLSLLGRNNVLSEVREMPIVGGSGMFRFARGYAQVRTHMITAEQATVEYNVFVYHY